MTLILCLGDTHQDTDELNRLLSKEYDIALIVGDFIDEGVLESIPRDGRKRYFILGNHDYEFFSYLPKLEDIEGMTFVRTGQKYHEGDMTLGGINGNYSPRNFSKDRKSSSHRRHFTRENVESCMRNLYGVDIFMTHEAPKEFGDISRMGNYFGCGQIRKIVDSIQPSYTIAGHIHELQKFRRDDLRSINVGYGLKGDHVFIGDDRIELIESERLDW